MRPVIVVGGGVMLASCTLLVPIDDDLTSGSHDGGSAPAFVVGPDGALVEVAKEGGSPNDAGVDAPLEPYDSGEVFAPPRDGCPNGVAQDPQLAAYYPFDETGGTVLHDCSLQGHDLKTLNAASPKWTAGHIDGAADFDGTDGCFGATDANLNKFESQPFSVSVWVLARQYFEAAKTGRWIVSHKISPRGWHVGVDDPNRLELDLEWNDGTDHKTQISATTALNEWNHYVTTYSKDQEARVYKNGALIAKESGAKVPTAFGATATTFFRIGCRGPASGVFDGKIDELRIYPLVLTEAQIKLLAAAR